MQRQDHRDEAGVHGAENGPDQKLGIAQTQHHPVADTKPLGLQRLAGANDEIRKLSIGNPPPLAKDRVAVARTLKVVTRKQLACDVVQRRSPCPGQSFTPLADPFPDRTRTANSLVRSDLAVVHNRRME